MSAGDGLRLFMIILGVVILSGTIISLARKHLTETFCIAWGVIAAAAIFAGIVLRPTEWSRYMSGNGLSLILLGLSSLLAGAFFVSVRISQLNREVKELAIRVALLDQENAMLLRERGEDTTANETEDYEEKTPVCH